MVSRAVRLLAHADEVFGLGEASYDDEVLAIDAWARALDLTEGDLDFSATEWALIADVCNGTLFESGWLRPGMLVAANVEDGHRLNGAGYRWLGSEGADLAGSLHRVGVAGHTEEMTAVDAAVADLVRRLAALDYVGGWAVIRAVRWFWAHCELSIDVRAERWWTSQYRRLGSPTTRPRKER